jgi:hypothetical protein
MLGETFCRSCLFWQQIESADAARQDVGNCHRYPPSIVGNVDDFRDDQDLNIFPECRALEWCGEWKKKNA